MGDRSAEGQRTLTPSTQVRILVPQPLRIKGLAQTELSPFFIVTFQKTPIFNSTTRLLIKQLAFHTTDLFSRLSLGHSSFVRKHSSSLLLLLIRDLSP